MVARSVIRTSIGVEGEERASVRAGGSPYLLGDGKVGSSVYRALAPEISQHQTRRGRSAKPRGVRGEGRHRGQARRGGGGSNGGAAELAQGVRRS